MAQKPAKTILVTGGAGYIGSMTSRELISSGYDVVVLDSFVKGRRFAVERNAAFARERGRTFSLEEGDLADTAFLAQVIGRHRVDAVIHFAAFIEVAESVARPALYFHNNIVNTVRLLDAMAAGGVTRIVFSSSAAVYGNPDAVPIPEGAPVRPINPYGYTKLSMERMIRSYQDRFGIEWVALRYFNAAGASPDTALGEAHWPESHLIPNAIEMVARGGNVKVFGNDYDTSDGTCLRDFISVTDLARAHRLALELTEGRLINRPYNLGSGNGFTVDAVVRAVGSVMGLPATSEHLARRPGDPDKLVASSDAFQKATGWTIQDSRLEEILKTAAAWYRARPEEALQPKVLPADDESAMASRVQKAFDANRVIPRELKEEIVKKLAGYSART